MDGGFRGCHSLTLNPFRMRQPSRKRPDSMPQLDGKAKLWYTSKVVRVRRFFIGLTPTNAAQGVKTLGRSFLCGAIALQSELYHRNQLCQALCQFIPKNIRGYGNISLKVAYIGKWGVVMLFR